MAKPVVYIIIYSLYHHVYKLSLSVKQGLESKGVEVKLFQVPETLGDDILVKMQAPPKLDLPYITIDKLAEPDGIIFGFPTRFGTLPAQMKTFLDASGALWAKGALAGKFAATFFSTASQHGGQETTALTTLTYFAHHGMLYVPFGYANAALENNDEVTGGSAYGAGTISDGDGSRQPTENELGIAVNQGANFGDVITTFVKGRDGPGAIVNNKSTAPGDSNNSTSATTKAGAAAAATAGTAAVAATTAATTKAASSSGATNTASAFKETTSATANVAATTAATTAAGAESIKKLLGNATAVTNNTTKSKQTSNNNPVSSNNQTNTSNSAKASKTGADAGATAVGNANVVKESIVKPTDKTKKKKKWFCCM
ncbi:unnamed protein product [Mucor hiemalis]